MTSPTCNVQIDRYKVTNSALNLLYENSQQKDNIVENPTAGTSKVQRKEIPEDLVLERNQI